MSRMLRGAAAGLALGVAWGALARVFMRLLATEPSFSWSGTLLVVGLAGLAGASVGLVRAARTAGRSRWWRLAGAPAVLLFLGQGLLLLPGAVGFAAVLRGGSPARVVGASLVAVPPVLVVVLSDDGALLGVTAAQLAGLAVMTAAAAPLGWGLGELTRRWRPLRAEDPPAARVLGPQAEGPVPAGAVG